MTVGGELNVAIGAWHEIGDEGTGRSSRGVMTLLHNSVGCKRVRRLVMTASSGRTAATDFHHLNELSAPVFSLY